MPVKEILRGVIFLRRVADGKDFNEVVNCVPDERMNDLEAGLIARRDNGEIDSVQIGRHRKEAHPLSSDEDQVDAFFAKIDSLKLEKEECPHCHRPYSSTDRAPLSESGDSSSILDEATTPEEPNDPIGS